MPDLVIDLSRVALKRRRTKTVATVGLQQELAGLGEATPCRSGTRHTVVSGPLA